MKFLLTERVPFTSVELITRLTDSDPAPTRCAWCPDFVPVPGQETHGICPTCYALVQAALDVEEANRDRDDDDDDRDELCGAECGGGCGYCGRCS